jgi:hypothetical protein
MVEPSNHGTGLELDDVSDGLPVIAPTRARVDELLAAIGVDGSERIGRIPPRGGMLTYESAAANAVMTGCTPDQFWVVIESMKTMLEPRFKLPSMQTTTHPVGACLIVSGPMADQVGVHGGTGCLGPGFKANARIGRAVRLIQLNVGGAWPGSGDMATMGSPAKWTFCFSDQSLYGRDGTYWPTIAEEFTGRKDASVICAAPVEAPHNVNDHFSSTASGVLRMITNSLANVGSNHAHQPNSTPVVIIGPEHAEIIASEGFTRDDARNYIARHARIPLKQWSPENQKGRIRERFPKLYAEAEDSVELPIILDPQDLVIAVAGGVGRHSMVAPSFGLSFAVTREALPLPR